MKWDAGRATNADLYYDPVVDRHVASPIGLIAPAWYWGPQRPEMGEVAWEMLLAGTNVLSGELPEIWKEPGNLTFLLQLAGEHADPDIKYKIWDVCDEMLEPTWDYDLGEFTLGLGLNEPYPRGQLNARIMAGWVCKKGAWSDIFRHPNFDKFSEPTVVGVDFPSVALRQAHWDGQNLHLAVQPQNDAIHGKRTSFRVTNLDQDREWVIEGLDGSLSKMNFEGEDLVVEIEANDHPVVLKSKK